MSVERKADERLTRGRMDCFLSRSLYVRTLWVSGFGSLSLWMVSTSHGQTTEICRFQGRVQEDPLEWPQDISSFFSFPVELWIMQNYQGLHMSLQMIFLNAIVLLCSAVEYRSVGSIGRHSFYYFTLHSPPITMTHQFETKYSWLAEYPLRSTAKQT